MARKPWKFIKPNNNAVSAIGSSNLPKAPRRSSVWIGNGQKPQWIGVFWAVSEREGTQSQHGLVVLLSSWMVGRKRGSAATSSAHWPVLAFLCWQERQRGSVETRAGERRDERERGRRSWRRRERGRGAEERKERKLTAWEEERGEHSLSVRQASRIEKDACRGTCARVKEVPARLHSQASSQSQGRSLLRRERATNQHGNLAA